MALRKGRGCSLQLAAFVRRTQEGGILMIKTITLALVIFFGFVGEANATNVFVWRHFGGSPYATTRIKAMRTRKKAFRKLGFPAPVVARFMRATKVPGRKTLLTQGERLSAMESKKGVHHDVVVDFTKPLVGGGKMEYAAIAERWQTVWRGRTYVVILPEICHNWSAILPANNESCYLVPFNYSHTVGVAWNRKHQAIISAHLGVSEASMEGIYNNRCFGVMDSTGFKKPFHRCEVCDNDGSRPPPAALANAVHLPVNYLAGSILSFRLKDGKGYLSLPKAWVVRWMLFCVRTKRYPITIVGYREWMAISRFDIVKQKEVEKTLHNGVLDRVLKGQDSY